jgi:hypothetical protein
MNKGNRSTALRVTFTALAGLIALIAASCSDNNDSSLGAGGSSPTGGKTGATGGTTAAKGGSTSSGGSTGVGGSSATGGDASLGGSTATGGSTSIGGTTATGGTTSMGGTTTANGGTPSAGTRATGGATATGGTASVAGATATGGTTAAAGATAAAGTTAAAGNWGTAGTTAVSYPSWSFTSDTQGWVGVTNATFAYYTGSDTFCATGCAQLDGNLASNGTFYNARIVFSSPIDLSGGVTITAMVKYIVPAGTDDFGTIGIYAQDSEPVVTGDDNWANGQACPLAK